MLVVPQMCFADIPLNGDNTEAISFSIRTKGIGHRVKMTCEPMGFTFLSSSILETFVREIPTKVLCIQRLDF